MDEIDMPEEIEPDDNFGNFVEWLSQSDFRVEDGLDVHIGNCPDCGMNEYFLHVFSDDEISVVTSCLWCGRSNKSKLGEKKSQAE